MGPGRLRLSDTILAIVLSFLKKYSGRIGHIHVDKGAKPQIVGSQSDPKPIVSKYATRQVRRVALQPTETEARRANDQSASARLTHDLLRQQQRLR